MPTYLPKNVITLTSLGSCTTYPMQPNTKMINNGIVTLNASTGSSSTKLTKTAMATTGNKMKVKNSIAKPGNAQLE